MKKSFIIHHSSLITNQKGATAILLAVLILSILLIIGLGVSALMIGQIKMSAQAGQSVQAFYAADAGAERCLYEVRKKGSNSCPSGTLDNNAAYSVTVSISEESGQISSIGRFAQTSRKIELNW